MYHVFQYIFISSLKECTPENLELKKQVFSELSKYADEGSIIASSTSCLMASLFTKDLPNRSHCIVAHPVSPFNLFLLFFFHLKKCVHGPISSDF